MSPSTPLRLPGQMYIYYGHFVYNPYCLVLYMQIVDYLVLRIRGGCRAGFIIYKVAVVQADRAGGAAKRNRLAGREGRGFVARCALLSSYWHTLPAVSQTF